MALKKIKLGDFAAGEIPNPILHTYTDSDGNPIAMSGWTILGFFVEGDGTINGTLEWVNAAGGEIKYTWHADDMQTPGRYVGLIWVQNLSSNPTLRFASDQFEWTVVDGPGPTPPTP